MSETCETCRYFKRYRQIVVPEKAPVTRRFLWWTWTEGANVNQDYPHGWATQNESGKCYRMPQEVQKHITEWCGEYTLATDTPSA